MIIPNVKIKAVDFIKKTVFVLLMLSTQFACAKKNKSLSQEGKSSMLQKKETKIDQGKFFSAFSEFTYFPETLKGHKRESVIERNSDMSEADRQRYRTQFKLRYLKKGKETNSALNVEVNNWSFEDRLRRYDNSIYPIEVEAKFELDPYNNPAQVKTYRMGDFYVNEMNSNTKYKPNQVTYYFKNGIHVQFNSYQYKTTEILELMKKTNFIKLADM